MCTLVLYIIIWVVVVYIGICYVNNIIEMKCTQNIHIYMKDTRHCCQSVYLYHTREYEELFPYCNMYIHNHYHNAHHIISSYLSFSFFFLPNISTSIYTIYSTSVYIIFSFNIFVKKKKNENKENFHELFEHA